MDNVILGYMYSGNSGYDHRWCWCLVYVVAVIVWILGDVMAYRGVSSGGEMNKAIVVFAILAIVVLILTQGCGGGSEKKTYIYIECSIAQDLDLKVETINVWTDERIPNMCLCEITLEDLCRIELYKLQPKAFTKPADKLSVSGSASQRSGGCCSQCIDIPNCNPNCLTLEYCE